MKNYEVHIMVLKNEYVGKDENPMSITRYRSKPNTADNSGETPTILTPVKYLGGKVELDKKIEHAIMVMYDSIRRDNAPSNYYCIIKNANMTHPLLTGYSYTNTWPQYTRDIINTAQNNDPETSDGYKILIAANDNIMVGSDGIKVCIEFKISIVTDRELSRYIYKNRKASITVGDKVIDFDYTIADGYKIIIRDEKETADDITTLTGVLKDAEDTFYAAYAYNEADMEDEYEEEE